MPESLEPLGTILLIGLPLAAWCAWWLGAVNWKKMGPTLAQGGWAPALLILFIISLALSLLAPGDCSCLGLVTLPHVWWQTGCVTGMAALALLCGWLQGHFGWTPEEIPVEPPPLAHGHGHDHGHGHNHH
jgi:hypothetical protein